MPRYFFHLVEGERVFPDHKGEDLPNDQAACDEAHRVAEELDAGGAKGDWSPRRFVVSDAHGRVVIEVSVQPVLPPGLPAGVDQARVARLMIWTLCRLGQPIGFCSPYRRILKRLMPDVEHVRCQSKQVLWCADSSLDHFFFPDSGVI